MLSGPSIIGVYAVVRMIGAVHSRFAARNWLPLAVCTIAATTFLFVDPRTMPIVLWDESRNFVNALEMRQTGWSLVTRYGGQPDLWNTKPPLLIWAMVASMDLFGASEWALRLPSALAALGTLWLVVLFVGRETGSLPTALLAASLLLLSPGFFAEHGARTADFDALLTFFTTAASMLLFRSIHRRPCRRTLLALAVAIFAAIMTKSSAGVVPLVGGVPYLLIVRRWRRTAGHVWAAAMVVAGMLLWLVVRERASPGYLAATWDNDLAGRFGRSLVGDAKPAGFYVTQLVAGFFAATPLLVAAPFALALERGRARLALLFSVCVAFTVVLAYSAAASKLSHYILPALPFMAIASAITVRTMLERLRSAPLRIAAIVASALLLTPGIESAVKARYHGYPDGEFQGADLYGELFANLRTHGEREVVVVDPGFALQQWPHYAPVLRAYGLLWRERGLHAIPSLKLTSSATPGSVVASCDRAVVAELSTLGSDRGHIAGCAAVSVPRHQAR